MIVSDTSAAFAYSAFLERLLQHMLYPDPAYRPPATEVYNALSNIINKYETSSSSIVTPSFVRRPDDSFDFDDFSAMADSERERGQMERSLLDEAKRSRYERDLAQVRDQPQRKLKTVQSEVLRGKEERAPTPLSESRKQKSSASVLGPAKQLVRRAQTPDQENVFYNGFENVRKEMVVADSPKNESES